MEFTPETPSTERSQSGMTKWWFSSLFIHLILLLFLGPYATGIYPGSRPVPVVREQVRTARAVYERKNLSRMENKIDQMYRVRDEMLDIRNKRIEQLQQLEKEMGERYRQEYPDTRDRFLTRQQSEIDQYNRSLEAAEKMARLKKEIARHIKQDDLEKAAVKAADIADKASDVWIAQERAIREMEYSRALLENLDEMLTWLKDEGISAEMAQSRQKQTRMLEELQKRVAKARKTSEILERKAEKIEETLDAWKKSGKNSKWRSWNLKRKLKNIAKQARDEQRLKEIAEMQKEAQRLLHETMKKAESAHEKKGIALTPFKKRVAQHSSYGSSSGASDMAREAQRLKGETDEIYRETRAAELSLMQGRAFHGVYDQVQGMADGVPDIDPEVLDGMVHNPGELREYKRSFEATVQDMDLILATIHEMRNKVIDPGTSVSEGGLIDVGRDIESQMKAIEDMEQIAGPQGGPIRDVSQAMHSATNGSLEDRTSTRMDFHPATLNVKAYQNGRKITSYGQPVDWFYIDSWYVIGPFPNPRRRNIDRSFPPEFIVDLDAEYFGKEGRLLKWEYVSSPTVLIVPPRFSEYAVFYAYTELYLDDAQDLWLAVGSDDRSDVWINDVPMWKSSNNLKNWNIGEGFRKVHLNAGFNRMLVRLENAWRECGFSVVVSLKER